MGDIVNGKSITELRDLLSDYKICIIVDDSNSMSKANRRTATNVVQALADEIGDNQNDFSLQFFNRTTPIDGRFNSGKQIGVEMAKIQFTHPTRPIDTMLSTLLKLEIDRLQSPGADFQKMIIIVVISGMPANSDYLRTSIESTVTSLKQMSRWTTDQIGVQFIQVGIDRYLHIYLKGLDDNTYYRELVDFTPSGVLSKERIWKMILGSVDWSFGDLDNSKLSTMVVPAVKPAVVKPAVVNPPAVVVNPLKIAHSSSSLLGPIQGYSIPLIHQVGFTITAWIFNTPNTTALTVTTDNSYSGINLNVVNGQVKYYDGSIFFTLPNFGYSFISIVYDPTKTPTCYVSQNTGIMHKLSRSLIIQRPPSLTINGFNGGKLENLKVYNGVLTDVQIKSDYIDVPKI